MSDTWRHISETTPVVRKRHVCYLCGTPILSGVQCVCRRGVVDGKFNTFYMHFGCEAVTRSWDQEDWECFDDPATFRHYMLEGKV